MKKYIYPPLSSKDPPQIVEAIPECGDYCDTCGDCLACYIEDTCHHNDDGEHMWVVYEDVRR